MSVKRDDISDDCPEMFYFMNEEESDVIFIVEGQRVPALKQTLSLKSRVFRAMFSGKFKESKEEEVVVEETTFEAFKTFIRFLYCDELVIKDDKDFQLILEVYKLSDKYDVKRLMTKITDYLKIIKVTHDNIELLSWIGHNSKNEPIMTKVIHFITDDFDKIIGKDINELTKFNAATKDQLLNVLVFNYRQLKVKFNNTSLQLEQFKQKYAHKRH